MKPKHVLFLGSLLLLACTVRGAWSQTQSGRVVRLAEIEVDPQQVEPYKTALREGIEAAIRLEPGVLTLYAVSVQGHPEEIRVFEVYASQAAYQAHLQTPHFRKYKAVTQGMIRSLRLIETDPILLGTQPRR